MVYPLRQPSGDPASDRCLKLLRDLDRLVRMIDDLDRRLRNPTISPEDRRGLDLAERVHEPRHVAAAVLDANERCWV